MGGPLKRLAVSLRSSSWRSSKHFLALLSIFSCFPYPFILTALEICILQKPLALNPFFRLCFLGTLAKTGHSCTDEHMTQPKLSKALWKMWNIDPGKIGLFFWRSWAIWIWGWPSFLLHEERLPEHEVITKEGRALWTFFELLDPTLPNIRNSFVISWSLWRPVFPIQIKTWSPVDPKSPPFKRSARWLNF